MCALFGLGHDVVNNSHLDAVDGRQLERTGDLRRLARVAHFGLCPAFRRNGRVNGVFQHQDAVGEAKGQRRFGTAFTNKHR